jgi:hypothetical protein
MAKAENSKHVESRSRSSITCVDNALCNLTFAAPTRQLAIGIHIHVGAGLHSQDSTLTAKRRNVIRPVSCSATRNSNVSANSDDATCVVSAHKKYSTRRERGTCLGKERGKVFDVAGVLANAECCLQLKATLAALEADLEDLEESVK